ncbi:MAG: HD domain-containing protein [Desulfovibrionaceae bacterium]|nr:HD domain-containing protein [Desulfovibrionaceae bacterium]
MGKPCEIRDPIHGFITLNDWERDIINHPVFQRLRRIRQLGMTDMVYPGATHTRFEHSLGVMHVATRMFDKIKERRGDFLRNELRFNEFGLDRDRVLLRLSSLLHDVGHAPFSHAGEDLMAKDPESQEGEFYKHENYSTNAILHLMHDVIEDHSSNRNYSIKVQEISDFLNGDPGLGRRLLWRSLVSGQLDADRADYLLRDSHHIGVAYGHYDIDRLIATLTVTQDETESPMIAVEEGGEHAAEGLIIARYMMFTQVYFHHTRRAYDHHCAQAVKAILQEHQRDDALTDKGSFPPPTTKENLESYLKWDDWRVLGLIAEGCGGEDGEILRTRRHHRRVFETAETPSEEEVRRAQQKQSKLGARIGFVDLAASSWYKFDSADIPLLLRPGQADEKLTTLSTRSSVVQGLKPIERRRIYVPFDKKEESLSLVAEIREKGEG